MRKYGLCCLLVVALALTVACSGSASTQSNTKTTTTTNTPTQSTTMTSQPITTTTTQTATSSTPLQFVDPPLIRSHQVGGEWADCLTGCHEQGGEDPFPLEGDNAHTDGRWETVDDCTFCHEVPEE